MRLEFIGDTIETMRTYDPATQRSIAPIDQIADRAAARRARTDDRGATLFDYLSRAKASRVIVSERDEVDAHAAKLVEQISNSYNEAVSRSERRAPPPARAARRLATSIGHAWRARHELAQLGLDDDAACRPIRASRPEPEADPSRSRAVRSPVASDPLSAGRRVPRPRADWVAEIRRLRDGRRDDAVRRRDRRPRRAHDRAAEGVRRLRRARRARRRCALRGGAGRRRRLSRGFRLPDAGPADLRRGRRLRGGAPRARAPPRRRRRRFCRTCAISRSAISSSTSITASAMFVGLKQIGDRRQRCRSSSSCATPARTSCSFRSSGSIWSRSTPAPRGRRSTARRHDVGARQDARQEGHARHGGGAAEALRRAQGRAGPRLQRRLALAAGVRGRVRVRADASIRRRRSPTSSATWSRRRRWIACCAATSATARPKSRCAPRSRR